MIETGLIIVTFASTSLPSELAVGYERLRIRPYIPLPLKCNNCFEYGHISKACKNEKICYNCSQTYHLNDEQKEKCSSPSQCKNCKSSNYEKYDHASVSKTCPIFLKEKEVQAIVTTQKVSKKQATIIYQQRFTNPATSYSSIVKNNNNSATTNNISNTNTTKVMPPPNIPTNSRNIKNYSDVMSEDATDATDVSDSDKQSSSKTNSKSPNKTITIAPRNTSKRTRAQLKKQLGDQLSNPKRTKGSS